MVGRPHRGRWSGQGRSAKGAPITYNLLVRRSGLRRVYPADPPFITALTVSEREVLDGIIAGYLGKQIAAQLQISAKTVETHRLHIHQKLHVHSSVELPAKLRDIDPAWRQNPGE